MRVIETFVTAVPREKISANAKWFMQDGESGSLKFSNNKEKPTLSKIRNMWSRFGYLDPESDNFGTFPLSTDASETIVTREELMKAYDLVEQGYTLWFGEECPVEKGTLVDVIYRNGDTNLHVEAGVYPCFTGSDSAKNAYDWSEDGVGADIIAYRLSKAENKPLSLPPLSEEKVKVIQANIKYKGHMDWSGGSFNSMAIDPESGEYEYEGNNLVVITKDEWNTYLDSIKIEVGDTVSFIHSDVFYEVLYVGEEKAFIKDSDGTEYSFPLEELSKSHK